MPSEPEIVYFLVNRQISKLTIKEAPRFSYIDQFSSSVIEFTRCAIRDNTVHAGRIHNLDPLSKGGQFVKWYEKNALWLRTRYKRAALIAPSGKRVSIGIAGPDAWRLSQQGWKLELNPYIPQE